MSIFTGSQYYFSIILFIPIVMMVMGEKLPTWVLVVLFSIQLITFILYVVEGLKA